MSEPRSRVGVELQYRPGLRHNDYDPVAQVYSRAMGADYGAVFGEALIAFLSRYGLREPPRWLDLACGAGDLLSYVTSRLKVRAVGLDLSRMQIEEAKGRTKPGDVELVVGDVLAPAVTGSFDLVTMSLDGLNHVGDGRNWTLLFATVREILRPDGLFIFDVNLPERLRDDWSAPEVILKEDVTYVQVTLDSGKAGEGVWCELLMQIFLRDRTCWERRQTVVLQHAYPASTIESMLRSVGLKSLGEPGEFTALAGRHLFLRNRRFFLVSPFV